jgi:glyoxylase-like metal-dependent hydrolase (beta-lactamase superfamily II)
MKGSTLLVAGFPAEAFGTNCYVLATGPGEQCLVIDPGIGVADQLDELLRKYRLHPAAVLLTHGHLDHVASVAPVCGARNIPAYIHPADRELLSDPAKGLSRDMTAVFGGRLELTEPDDVAPLVDGAVLPLVGLEITVDHAPGHTKGSVLFRLSGEDSVSASRVDHPRLTPRREPASPAVANRDGPAPLCFSGDVLFAGSIGRTDLPGGDTAAMFDSLRERVLPLPDETVVLPGHGPTTTIGRERETNPYLRQAAARATGQAANAAPTQGW